MRFSTMSMCDSSLGGERADHSADHRGGHEQDGNCICNDRQITWSDAPVRASSTCAMAMKIQLWCDDITTRLRLEFKWKALGATLLRKTATETPDCVVVDLAGRGALGRIAQLRERHPQVEIVVFAAQFDADAFSAAEAAGATELAAHNSIAERITRRIARAT